MKHTKILFWAFTLSFIVVSAGILSGCAAKNEAILSETAETGSLMNQSQPLTDDLKRSESNRLSEKTEKMNVEKLAEETADAVKNVGENILKVQDAITVLRPDWDDDFDRLSGTAVIFDPEENIYLIYNEDLADVRRSPCSTFKIISSLAGLESGVIDAEHSTRSWSGEIFWNEDWNQDMDFSTAFHTSCVWYYRQVIDDIGPDTIQGFLDGLQYGNCDISDWAGGLNGNNQNPALTGFWIESSLQICPREQTAVMYRIFGPSSEFAPNLLTALEEVMYFPQDSTEECKIYGKTGMGKVDGVVVDAWYTGFADVGRRIYFCVYLGETQGADVSSARAREIAVSLINEYFQEISHGT